MTKRALLMMLLAAGCGGSAVEGLSEDDLGSGKNAEVVVYSEDGWNELAAALAKDPAPGATYFMHIPAGSNDKTMPRGPVDPQRMRAHGAQFRAMAEFHWGGWRDVPGSWYDKGVEFRRRMAAQGYDVSKGDTWAINELPSTTRQGVLDARQHAIDAVRGLYDGPPGSPKAKGAVFIIGVGSSMQNFSEYKPQLESWLADAAFWNAMSPRVRFWGQETYVDPDTACVPGAVVGKKSEEINAFIEHVPALAAAGGSRSAAAHAFFAKSYVPLLNGAFRASAYQTDGVPLDQMKHFVSNQVYAARAWGSTHAYVAGRVGLGWTWHRDQVTAGEIDDLAQRFASAVHYAYAPNGVAAGACSASHAYTWCQCSLHGAAFNSGWSTFTHW